jgi:hypothetical protein
MCANVVGQATNNGTSEQGILNEEVRLAVIARNEAICVTKKDCLQFVNDPKLNRYQI